MSIVLNADEILQIAEQIERNGAKFYIKASGYAIGASSQKLLADLADMESSHEKAFSAMADTKVMKAQQPLALSKQGMSAPWFAEWINSMRREVQKAMLRQAKTSDVLKSLNTLWNQLKKE